MNSLASEDFNQISIDEQIDLHTDKELIKVDIPVGKLGITFIRVGTETVVTRVHYNANVIGLIKENDHLFEINGIRLRNFTVDEITKLFTESNGNPRTVTLMRPLNAFF
tara:strand:- start:1498 stop:1824 length:327 start_codon:yes stop_codon:yes gene_type:complete